MSCKQPLKAFRSAVEKTAAGLPALTFNPLKAINSTQPVLLPCGNCTGCRIDKREAWSVRCTHEAQMHEHNCFITLTYANEHLPEDYSVSVRVWQLFMKRLRLELSPTRVRFFACGEYGDQNLRPHYHALLFGTAFLSDREFHSTTTTGGRQYSSQALTRAWPFGRALLSDFEPALAGYATGYVMKKLGGDPAATHYLRTHPISGLTVKVQPEFAVQSRNPGIGATWFEKYKGDAFPSDFVVIDGRQRPVPRFYQLKLAEEEIAQLNKQRLRKKHSSREHFREAQWNNTPERLRVRETIEKDRLSRRIRTLKDDDQ